VGHPILAAPPIIPTAGGAERIPALRAASRSLRPPGPVHGGPEDHMADLARVQLLHLGRKRQIRVEPALGEEFQRLGGAIVDQVEIPLRIEPDMAAISESKIDSAPT